MRDCLELLSLLNDNNTFYMITNAVANHLQLAIPVYLYFLHIYHKRDKVFVPSLHLHNP